jgi:hypothetical protein
MSNNLTDLEGMSVIVKEFRKISKRNREVLINMLTHDHAEIGDTVDDPYYELRKQYLAAGGRTNNSNNFIHTIKLVREKGQIGLKEAKDLVESW